MATCLYIKSECDILDKFCRHDEAINTDSTPFTSGPIIQSFCLHLIKHILRIHLALLVPLPLETFSKMEKPIERRSVTAAQTGQEYVPSSKIRSAADIERAAAGVIDVDAKTTTYVVLACIIAASGGVLFGYDGGTTGKLRSASNYFALTCVGKSGVTQ